MLIRIFVILFITLNQSFATPVVCTTIKPIYSLVANVMKDVAQPTLIIDNNHSLHHYMLKPSDAQKIANADIIFMVSYNFEQFMHKIAQNLSHKNKAIVELAVQSEVKLMPARVNNFFEDHSNHDHHHDEIYDYHIWLDPINAIAMVKSIEATLSLHDQNNQKKYHRNAQDLIKRINKLNNHLYSQTDNIKDVPFLVFHDAYQYFEQRYQLKSVGAITLNPEFIPGASSMKKLNKLIVQNNIKCVFSEPQFPPTLVNKITSENKLHSATLDPEWEQTSNSIYDSYFALMHNLANNLSECLEK